MKPWAEAFYKSSAWKQVREAYIIYKHGICERCGGSGVIMNYVKMQTTAKVGMKISGVL